MNEIEVIYCDGMFGFVSPSELTHLIESREIIKFMRDDAWVFLGVDPTRTGEVSSVYVEKRRSMVYV